MVSDLVQQNFCGGGVMVERFTSDERGVYGRQKADCAFTGKPRVVALDDRLVIDTLRREAEVTRSALTHRHIGIKDLFLDCAAEREQEARDLRTPNEVALEARVDDLERRTRDLHTRATRWEGAACEPEPFRPNISPIGGRRRK